MLFYSLLVRIYAVGKRVGKAGLTIVLFYKISFYFIMIVSVP